MIELLIFGVPILQIRSFHCEAREHYFFEGVKQVNNDERGVKLIIFGV